MTTQNTGVPATPPALPKLTEEQIRNENADAAAASGFIPPQQAGASDAVTPPALPIVEPAGQADSIREGQAGRDNDREAFMNDIAQRRRQFMNDGEQPLDAYGIDNDEITVDNQPQETVTQVAQDVQPSVDDSLITNDQPRFFTTADGQRKVELLVNGQRQIVDESRVIAAAQKLEAGDERLREAAMERQRLDAERQQLERDRAALQNSQPSATDADQNLRQQLRDGLTRMYNEGDEAALDTLVDSIMAGRQPAPQIDTRQIADQVAADLNQKAWDANLQNDVAAYESDPAFADITGNPMFRQRAVEYAKKYMMENPGVRTNGTTPRQVMNHCAEIVRGEVQAFSQALNVQPAPQPQLEQGGQSRATSVEQRKTQVGNTVVGGSAQRQQASQQQVIPDGGRSPSSMDAKVAAFAGLQEARTQPVVRR